MSQIPPSDLDAEAAVLSASMLSSEALDDVGDLLKPEHWYSDANGLIWRAIVELSRAGQPVDVLTVAGHMRDAGTLDRAGGSSYIGQIVDQTPSVANVRAYAERIRSKWQLRSTIAACHRLAAEGYTESDVATYLDRAEQAIFEIASTDESGDSVLLGDALPEVMGRLHDIERGDAQLLGVTTGIEALDCKMSGLQRGDLTILAARPGMGKSALGIGMALAAAYRGWTSLHSLEMPRAQVVQRMIAQRANVDVRALRTVHELSERDWRSITEANEMLNRLPVAIDDGSSTNLFQLRRRLRRTKRQAQRNGSDLALVVVDYLQLMAAIGSGRGRSREQEVSEISRGLKALAKQLDVPILALSQLSRRVEERTNKRPMLSDLRESGAIEQDADNVLFLYRKGYYLEQCGKVDDTDGETEIIIAKQRNGPTGSVKCQWWSACASFTDLESSIPERAWA